MGSKAIGRRTAIAAGTALATASLIRPREAHAAKALTVVLESEVTILDPHATTVNITRSFALHVFDMLFADKLFKLFQRLHREEDFGGQGVGLVTAQRVVQRHGGRIWANAEKSRGATFRFTLWDDLAVRNEVEEDLRQRLAG